MIQEKGGFHGEHRDQHTLDRLDALVLLLKEVDPGCRCDRNEALRLSVDVGLKMLLGELLARGHSETRPQRFAFPLQKGLEV